MKVKKRCLSLLLAAVMVITMLPATAYAEENTGMSQAETVACTVTEGCTLEDGHEGDCVLPDTMEGEPTPDVSLTSEAEPTLQNGEGTVDNPYQISTAADLEAFRDEVNGGSTKIHAKLMKDIDLNPGFTFDNKGGYTSAEDSATEPKQWVPIGSSSKNFTGTFNGQGYTISGLYIHTEATDGYLGLFGQVGKKGIVKGINLKNSSIYAQSATNVGGIVGYNYKGKIEDCSGNAYVYGKKYVGGITGNNYKGNIRFCYNTGSVSTVSGNGNGTAGGIAGENMEEGLIEQCFNTGSISSGRGSYFGGIAGHNHYNSRVKNCYNVGTIKATSANQVGGIIGNNESNALIENCYNIGEVKGKGDVGAVAGKNNNSTVQNCYYLKGDAKGIGYDNKEGRTKELTASQMTGVSALTNMQGLSEEIWQTKENEASGDGSVTDTGIVYEQDCYLPKLKVFGDKVQHSSLKDTVVKMKQDEDGFWCIYTLDQLETYRNIVNDTLTDKEKYSYTEEERKNQNGRLMKELEMNAWLNDSDFDENGKYIATGAIRQWTPIGTTEKPFTGTFDGNGKLIRYMYIYEPGKSAGLFGVSEGIIENLKIFNSRIAGGDTVGAVAGDSSGEIRNCESTGIVIGDNMVGGITGLSKSSIIGCIVRDTEVTGKSVVGGIAGMVRKESGDADMVILSQCGNKAQVTQTASGEGNEYGAGGICGRAEEIKFQDCYNSGKVSSPVDGKGTGGIVGFISSGSLKNVLNVGDISGGNSRGALVGGKGEKVDVTNSYYLDTTCTGGTALGISKTKEELKSGEVVYLLNGKIQDTEIPIWGQDIRKDSYPTFYDGDNRDGTINARKVTLTAGEGYTLTSKIGSWAPNCGSFTFEFAMEEDGYKTGSFAVLIDDKPITLNEDGSYTIPKVEMDTTITVTGTGKDTENPTKPMVSATVDGKEYDGSWTSGDVLLTVSDSKAASGIKKYQYSIDGGKTWTDMTPSETSGATDDSPETVKKAEVKVDKDANGAKYLFQAISGVNKISEISDEVVVKVDKIEPTIVVIADTDTYKPSDTVTVNPQANISGIAKVEVRKGNGEYTDITDSYREGYTVNANGTYTFQVTNGAGVSKTTTITYDKITYLVTVNVEGGGEASASMNYAPVGAEVVLTASPDKETHFKEWRVDVEDVEVKDGRFKMPDSPVTVTAVFETHTFDQKITEDKYLESKADCEAPASYYYSCKCGAKGTESFEHGKANGHSWGEWTKDKGKDSHTRTCKNCPETETENCSGGTATCTALAVCATCGNSYGTTDPNKHTDKIVWTKTETTHSSAYNCCKMPVVTEEAHGWKNDTCTECGYVCQHKGGEATCTEQAVCEICTSKYGEVNTLNHTNLVKTEAKPATHMEEGHQEYWYCEGCDKYFSNEAGTEEIALKDTVIPKLPEHTADDTGWHTDEKNHWNVCECGEILNKEEHTFGEWTIIKGATDTEIGSREKSCNVCGYKATESIPVIDNGTDNGTGDETTTKPTDSDKEKPNGEKPDNEKSDKETDGVKTGDNSNLFGWIMVAFISSGVVLTLTLKSRKRKNQ